MDILQPWAYKEPLVRSRGSGQMLLRWRSNGISGDCGTKYLVCQARIVPVSSSRKRGLLWCRGTPWVLAIRGLPPLEEFAIAIWHKLQSWKVIHFSHLPQWLQDNDFLHFGHRPPLPPSECFKSIIRIHTETKTFGPIYSVSWHFPVLSRPST